MSSSRQRLDLTEWIVHFVHDVNHEYIPDDAPDGTFLSQVFHGNSDIDDRFDIFRIYEEEQRLEDWSSFGVLARAIETGIIRTGFAWRNQRPTVYGLQSTCCFSEMPLYGLLAYSRARGKSGSVSPYCIAVQRNEFIRAGGLPVIYGLTRTHKEIDTGSWPRLLDPSCGLGEREQYRYVRLSLDDSKFIDWSHEREWRWSDVNNEYDLPGLPFLVDIDPDADFFKRPPKPPLFSRVLILVETETESECIINQLKAQHDAGSHDYGWVYSRQTLEETYVVSHERLKRDLNPSQYELIRFDDLPLAQIPVIRKICASDASLERAKKAMYDACLAAEITAKDSLQTAQKTASGFVADVAGFAYVFCPTEFAHMEEVAALNELGVLTPLGAKGYYVGTFGSQVEEQALCIREAAARAAAKVLNEQLADIFEVRSFWD